MKCEATKSTETGTQLATSAGQSPEQFASATGLHPESIRRSIRKGDIQAVRFGRFWRIPPGEAGRILQNGLPSIKAAA